MSIMISLLKRCGSAEVEAIKKAHVLSGFFEHEDDDYVQTDEEEEDDDSDYTANAPPVIPNVFIHHGYGCNQCGEYPIKGTRFHLKGTDVDLCEEDFYGMPEHVFDKTFRDFEIITGQEEAHRGVVCDACGMKPILGPRFKKNGEDFDLCEHDFRLLSTKEQANYTKIGAQALATSPQPCPIQ
jgi:hypothetical protein